jgi:purine-binding chemotaxis protein CheW
LIDVPTNTVVTFRVGSQTYGLPIHAVKEIIPMVAINPFPITGPEDVDGFLNLRGEAIPVLDLRRCWGIAPRSSVLDARIVIAREGQRIRGVIVDEVLSVVTTPVESIGDQESDTRTARFFAGVGEVGGELVMLLEPRSVFEMRGVTAQPRLPRSENRQRDSSSSGR